MKVSTGAYIRQASIFRILRYSSSGIIITFVLGACHMATLKMAAYMKLAIFKVLPLMRKLTTNFMKSSFITRSYRALDVNIRFEFMM